MHGFPLDTAKTLMRDLLAKLRPTDSFNIVLFSGAAHVRSPQGRSRRARTRSPPRSPTSSARTRAAAPS